MEGRIDGNAAVASDGLAVWFALNGRIVVFDTETTGLDEDDEILQLAAIEFVKGVQTRTFNAYINPVLEHDDIGTDIHGITEKFLKKNGRKAKDVLDEFFGFLGDNVLLVAHNIKFDVGMLRQECSLCENAIRELRQVKLCNTVLFAYSQYPELSAKNGGCGYALETLIEEFGIDAKNSHRADDDADACAKLFFRLVKTARYGRGGGKASS